MADSQKIKQVNEILEKYDCFIFDMDGVLYSGNQNIEHSYEFLNYLKNVCKKQVFFLTNNAGVDRKYYREVLSKNGYEANMENIYSASYIAAKYLYDNHPEIKKVYVIGMEGIVNEMNLHGIQCVGSRDDEKFFSVDQNDFGEIVMDEDIKAVVVGIDWTVNYYKFARASIAIQKNNAIFIATNEDQHIKVGKYGNLIPGGGTLVNALAFCSGVKPYITGKPNSLALEMIQKVAQTPKEKCLMIGDNLQTDILFGKNAGIDTLLVMTGVTKERDVEANLDNQEAAHPTYIVNNLKFQ